MTKQEILEAINSTIATNGVKGITAESLANILTEIVNATPEGGSGGSGGEYLDMTFIDQETMELADSAKAHNAELYTKLFTALTEGTPAPMVSVNGGLIMYPTNIVPTESGNIDFYMNMPNVNEANNIILSGYTSDSIETQVFAGTHTVLMILSLSSDGTIAMNMPGMM